MRMMVGLSSFVFLLTGCVHFSPIAVSTSSINPELEIPLGFVQGVAVNSLFLGIPARDEEGMKTAVNRAKVGIDADNLVNVYVDQRVTYYPFTILPIYTRIETIVYGTAVRYKDRSLSQLKDHS